MPRKGTWWHCIIVSFFFLGKGQAMLYLDPAWGDAMNRVFVLSSKSSSVSGNLLCTKSIMDLMIRQSIPLSPLALRALNDTELLQIAMTASVAGISSWKRDSTSNTLFQLTEQGRLVSPYTPNAVESDVMLCIICALLIVIAIFHLAPATI
jgi:hypothetical protein